MNNYILSILLFLSSFAIGQNIPSNSQNSPAQNSAVEIEEKINLESDKSNSKKAKKANRKDEANLNQNSFEYNYNAYLASSIKNQKSFEFLQKAYEIYPENVALYDDFMAYYEMNGNETGRRQFSTKLAKSNTISNYLMEYNFNVLASLPKNSILFTNGFDDTYPIWIAQDVNNVRKDITVINISLLDDKSYRKRIFEKENIKYNKSLSGVELIADIMKSNSHKELYIGLTIDKKIIEALHKNLYLVGLVFKYSEKPFSNIKQTTDAWENSFKKASLNSAPSSFKQKQVMANYLIPFIYMHNRYVEIGEIEKAKELKKLTLKIAKYNGKLNVVNSKLK